MKSFNINYKKDVALSSFIPCDELPSRPFFYDDDLQAMIDEISVNNEDAFREVLRMQPLAGKQKPRLAYARNFFGSLEDMARYWDTDKDDYHVTSGVKSGEKIKLAEPREETSSASIDKQTSGDTDVVMHDAEPSATEAMEGKNGDNDQFKEVYRGYRLSNAEAMNPGTRIAMTKNFLKMVMHKFNCRDHEPMPAPREKFVFRGVKIQSIQYHFCVGKVPDNPKQARARFVEGPLMAVHIRDELRFKAKEGLLSPEKTPFVGEKFDLLREVGCMLILAKQRAREQDGQTDKLSESNKWWVSQPRWGGGPTKWGQLAHEIFEEDDPSWSPEEKKLQEEKRKRTEEEHAKGLEAKLAAVNSKTLGLEDLLANAERTLPGSSMTPAEQQQQRRRKFRSMERPPGHDPSSMKDGKRLMYTPPFRRKWYQEWQKLRPNTSTQDDRVIYKQIGKQDEQKGGFDDIYMVSSVNHHISLVKMRVHIDYLEWLESGKEVHGTPDTGPESNSTSKSSEKSPNVLYVCRSKWYDMFDVESRKELLIAMWRVMCWINRKVVPEAEVAKVEEMRKKMAE